MGERPSDAQKILSEARNVRDETIALQEKPVLEEARKRLFQPIDEVDNHDEGREISEEEYKLKFRETDVGDQDKEGLVQYVEERTEFDNDFSDVSSWREITELEYLIGDASINVLDLIPDGYKILFCPNSSAGFGSVIYQRKTIYLANDIASLGSLVIILHEVGHARDIDKLEQMSKSEFVEGGSHQQKEVAERLRKEREASLYALRKLWRILRDYPQIKSDIKLYLKNIAYFGYCKSGLNLISTAESMAHFAQDYEDVDDDENDWWLYWEDFKDSKDYQEWKKDDRFANLEESEEYGEWRKWMEKEARKH